MPGNSSPVIWENKLFLTGADEETQKIFCFNIEDGKLLWEADVTRAEAKVKADEIYEDTGYAAPTPVVDGRHVYAMFANGELVAVDFAGKLVWRKSFGIPENSYGFASSPALCFDRLIVQFDDGDGSEGNSKLVALDLTTGSILWETPREDLHSTWASPMLKRIGEAYQIISCANPFVIAYNPEDGQEIWRCRCLSGGDVGPSPISLGNVVFIANESPRNTAVDSTGTGDVTTTHILWNGNNATPDTSSPLATDEYFVTISAGGFMTGYDPKVINPNNKRARYWELELGDLSNFYSSPLRVGTYIYAFDKTKDNPRAFVIDLSKVAVGDDGMLTDESEKAMIIAENPMPEPVVTSPAMLNDRLYIRGLSTLYCIGNPKQWTYFPILGTKRSSPIASFNLGRQR
jgi:outer membrane protein assembly factor BamB